MCGDLKVLGEIFSTISLIVVLISGPSAFAANNDKTFKPQNNQFGAEKSRADAITGGQTIDRDPLGNAKDFVVMLSMNSQTRSSVCTGVALTSELILTAGHCIDNEKINAIEVRVIRQASPLKFEELEASDWRVHPGHAFLDASNVAKEKPTDRDLAGLADLGLIRLKKPSSYAIPAVIVPEDLKPEELKDPSLFSFGYERDPKRKYVFTSLVTFTELKRPTLLWGRRDMYISPTRTGTMVCKGDSGGPVTIGAEDDKIPGRQIHYLLGIHSIVSSGIDWESYNNTSGSNRQITYLPCGEKVFYVNVINFLDWIIAAAESMAPGSSRQIQRFGRN